MIARLAHGQARAAISRYFPALTGQSPSRVIRSLM